MINKYKWWETAAIYLGLAVFLTFILAPFVEAFTVSLRPMDGLFSVPYRFITKGMSFQAYVNMWSTVPHLLRYIVNSLFIALAISMLGLVAVIPAAYAFARCEFRGKGALLGAFLAVNMMSGAVLIIPLYKVMQSLGLLNTYLAIILPGTAFSIPTKIWLLRSYLLDIPRELEEAALVDGASRIYTLVRVIIPIAMPGIIVVAVAGFITGYAQQFIYAITFNSINEINPLPVGLFQFFGQQEVLWNELMAASLVGILPVLVVYAFLQKHVVAGLTAGAIKS